MYFQFQSIYCFMKKYNNKSVALQSHTFETVTIYLDFLNLLLIYACGLVLLAKSKPTESGGSFPTCSHTPWALLSDERAPKRSARSGNPWNLMGSVLLHCDWYPASRPGLLIDFCFIPFATFGLDFDHSLVLILIWSWFWFGFHHSFWFILDSEILHPLQNVCSTFCGPGALSCNKCLQTIIM